MRVRAILLNLRHFLYEVVLSGVNRSNKVRLLCTTEMVNMVVVISVFPDLNYLD